MKTIAIIVLCLMAAVMGAKHNDHKKNHHHKAAANVTVLGTKALGRTTRYWDCCKPHCGWPDKGTNKPVDTCAANGYDVVGSLTTSVCDNGDSHTCNNNQPFVINSQLSYGFAATGGGDGSTPCCKCFQFDFTTTSLAQNGKRMIVMVSNAGGDLGSGQFDILIPGGGVGLFNGCTKQWGAPADGWGNRYGGVNSESECNQLPGELQEGCRWRFQWFENADNPEMNYYEVGCPAELIDRSGNCRA